MSAEPRGGVMKKLGSILGWLTIIASVGLIAPGRAPADETCLSPYMPKIVGPEDYVYVWTLGVEGIGNGSDKPRRGERAAEGLGELERPPRQEPHDIEGAAGLPAALAAAAPADLG